jgi:hypothetical protein
MAEKKEKKPRAAVEPEEGQLVSAAKVVGATAGKIAALAGAEAEAPPKTPTPPTHPKKAKLAKKNKSRLPRKQKKALQKAARGQQS